MQPVGAKFANRQPLMPAASMFNGNDTQRK
jgi:hypothetical protein